MTTESLITRLRTPSVWVHHESYSTPEPAGHERDSAPFEAADAMAMQARQIQEQAEEIEQLRAQRGEPENIDPTGSNLPAEQANTPEVTSQGQVSVPVLWRYRDSEQCIKPMDGYTPGEGWTPLYAAPQPERKPMTDDETLALFDRVKVRMLFTDAEVAPFASGVAAAEHFHGIKDKQ